MNFTVYSLHYLHVDFHRSGGQTTLFFYFSCILNIFSMSFPSVSVVKNPLALPVMQVRFLVLEDPLEKEMATHSRILAWEIPWIEEPSGLQSMGSQETDTT